MNIELNESSLSRVWQHYSDPDTAFGILTAFRGEYSAEENRQRNRSLAADVRDLGYGFFYLDGYWIENQGTDLERRVKEDSLFVISRNQNGFAANIHKLGNRYNQEAVVVKDSNGVQLINKDGSKFDLGSLKPGSMGEIYSKLRRRKDATFVFESERDDIGWLGRLAGIQK
jgi:hypothetical protein